MGQLIKHSVCSSFLLYLFVSISKDSFNLTSGFRFSTLFPFPLTLWSESIQADNQSQSTDGQRIHCKLSDYQYQSISTYFSPQILKYYLFKKKKIISQMQNEQTEILKVFEGLWCPELNNETFSIHFYALLNEKDPIVHP